MVITDNIVVHGKDDIAHEKFLHKFMEIAQDHGLTFNSKICAVKQPTITVFGFVYDENEVHPDPERVSTVHNMPAPETTTQLWKLLSMVTQLSSFVPSLFSFTVHL